MKRAIIITLLIVLYMVGVLIAQESKTALILIDIQEFYFEGGRSELVNPVEAALKSAKVLEVFRNKNLPVIHVKHNSKTQSDINKTVKPIEGEEIIVKDHVNSFRDTRLLFLLRQKDITDLVIVGMQTHMCVEGAVRAGDDLGFKVTLLSDACATKDLKHGDTVVKASDVHSSTLSTLGAYAKVMTVDSFLKEFK